MVLNCINQESYFTKNMLGPRFKRSDALGIVDVQRCGEPFGMCDIILPKDLSTKSTMPSLTHYLQKID